MREQKTYGLLFLTFLKIGAFTFGGGYAMIPLIEEETVKRRKWIADEDILDIVAVAESTPGPIAINAATFVGYKVAGVMGALLATCGVVLPSFFIILAVAVVLQKFADFPVVQHAFVGVRAGVLALIIKAMVTMYQQCPKHVFSYVIGIAAFLSVAFMGVNVLTVIILAALLGVAYTIMLARRAKT